jgi:hypothetical protein
MLRGKLQNGISESINKPTRTIKKQASDENSNESGNDHLKRTTSTNFKNAEKGVTGTIKRYR